MRVGCIGSGNMARALLGGFLAQGLLRKEEILASDVSADQREQIREELGVQVTEDNHQVASSADRLILAVKPQFYEAVIHEIKDDLAPETIVITLAPGKTLAWLEEQFGRPVRLVRTMPNTPALVGEGMLAYCRKGDFTDAEKEELAALFASVGNAQEVPETLMDTVTGVSGSSPAYVFLFIEALADAAVEGGMPREQAYTFAAQSVLGSAKMVLKSGRHPADLKDMVCSPGGTTIEAIRVLEERGFRSAILEATRACIAKSRGM